MGRECSYFIMPEPRTWHRVLSCQPYFIGQRRPRATQIHRGGDTDNHLSIGGGVKEMGTIFNPPHSSFIPE